MRNCMMMLIVRFLENANEQYDKIGDAYKMYGNYEIPQIFTYIEDGTELSINALPPEKKDNAIVPLGVFVAMDGTFQFTAIRNGKLPASNSYKSSRP